MAINAPPTPRTHYKDPEIVSVSESQDFEDMENGLALHSRCMAGDITVFDKIFTDFVVPLTAGVKMSCPAYFDPSQFQSAAVDALMSYFRAPDRYNPAKGLSLFKYLLMAAKRDFLNLMDKDTRQMHDQFALVVEDDDDGAELDIKDPAYRAFDELLMHADSRVWADIQEILPDPLDQACVYAMMDGERSTTLFVEIYGIEHLPPKEQEHEVKRHKDRVKKRLYRKLDREEYRRYD